VLKVQISKTNLNLARGMAQVVRVGLYRLVHVKTLRNQRLQSPKCLPIDRLTSKIGKPSFDD
jgi:hypothetical protein